MKYFICHIILMFSLILFIAGCGSQGEPINTAAEIQEISRVIDSAVGWFKTKDFSVMFNTFAQDSNLLEVHPDGKVVRGFEQFRKNAEIFKNPAFLYVRHELWDLKINLSKNGDTAWFFCMLNDISTWEGQQVGWENTRWTGVLEKRDGRWVIVQQHFSWAKEIS